MGITTKLINMLSNLTKRLITIITLCILISCNKNLIPSIDDSQVINVCATVTTLSKAGYESTTTLPEKFLININQGPDSKFNYSLIEMQKQSNNSYTAEDQLIWDSDDHSTVSIKAMTIPYGLSSVDFSGPMAINICVGQNRERNIIQSDVLGVSSGNGVTIDGNTVHLGFNHLMSKLEVTYEFGAGFDESQIDINAIFLNNICVRGGYNYSLMDYDSSIDLDYGNITMFHSSSEQKAEAIFYPYTPTENPTLTINVTISGIEYEFSCPVVSNDNNGFIGGKRYKMNVAIIGNDIAETSASIAAGWNTDTENQDCFTE